MTYLNDKVETLKRSRDTHNCLAQIALRAAADQEHNVEEEEVQIVDPPEKPPVEAIDVDSSSTFSFDTQ